MPSASCGPACGSADDTPKALEDVSIPAGRGIIRAMKHEALVSDDLWEAIEPFLPEELPKPKGGGPGVPDRAALAGIVFVLRTGIA